MATAMAMGLLAQPAITHLDGDEATVDLVDDHEGPEEAASRNELMIKVHEAIDSQPDAERHLLKRTYIDGVDLTVAAKEIGLSKSWASRIHARGIEAVTKRLKLQRVAP
jgi:RNA polymerase sigma factor for flagellar operon FliA